ncbi:iap-3 [Cryptophlebia leucotreta granulovirus]|uniref:Iap-3 n=1 Tax=Cryptophlebia leucotreta granulosis virus TaxID=35254 RepID=Q7T5S1_GVCL|nr:iap-3 [Cryptophlebia leucotreta granulovirus]AAQ21613.1 iap-3 [Cryptophlebia leucotreta granulovirus]
MESEVERLKTFVDWPVVFLSPQLLAKNGFYYLGRSDEVRCAFCKVEIMRWKEDDDPETEHRKWSPQCSLFRGNGVDIPPQKEEEKLTGPAHDGYISHRSRLDSFKTWPFSMTQKADDMAQAGFFYTGKGDRVICYYCDGKLSMWERDEDPWEEHARWYGSCAFLKLVKGEEFIQKIHSERCMLKDESLPPSPQTQKLEDAENDNDLLCKICFDKERNVCFVPCHHVVACVWCALVFKKCPACQQDIKDVIRLYFV